jgi:cysteine synthase
MNRYECHLNSEAHDEGTGAEVWQQTGGTVTHFVAGGSTGGTVTGVGRHLKRCNPNARVVLADPVGSIFHDVLCQGFTQVCEAMSAREGRGGSDVQ